jgi:hypothetical protein
VASGLDVHLALALRFFGLLDDKVEIGFECVIFDQRFSESKDWDHICVKELDSPRHRKYTRVWEIMGSISTSSNGTKSMSAVQKLRSLLADPDKFIACPGVYDGFTARIALQEGVDCLYMVPPPSSPSTTSHHS